MMGPIRIAGELCLAVGLTLVGLGVLGLQTSLADLFFWIIPAGIIVAVVGFALVAVTWGPSSR